MGNKRTYNGRWYVYMAECHDTTLYVGTAKDVEKRITAHNKTSQCKYTRHRKPIRLVYKEEHPSYSVARKREVEVKKFSRKKKLELINNI